MASLNEIMIIGRLGKDPEMKYTPGGKAVTKLSVATDRKYPGADGQMVTEATWHNVDCWGKLAELCNQYLAKGRMVFVQGRQDHRSYKGTDGVTKYFSSITANTVLFLDKNGAEAAQTQGEPAEDSLDFSVVPETGF